MYVCAKSSRATFLLMMNHMLFLPTISSLSMNLSSLGLVDDQMFTSSISTLVIAVQLMVQNLLEPPSKGPIT